MNRRTVMVAAWLLATTACVDSILVDAPRDDVRLESDPMSVQADLSELRFQWGLPYLLEGETRYLQAVGLDAHGRVTDELPIVYSASNESRISVSATGAVTGLRAGVVEVIARYQDLETRLEITVEPAAAQWLHLSKDFVELDWLQTTDVFVTAYNDAETMVDVPVEWVSLDPSVARVDHGHIEGVARGYTRIIVTSGDARAEVGVRVVSPPVMSVDVVSGPRNLVVGEGGWVEAVALADDRIIDDAEVRWTSQNPGVVWVEAASGRLKAVGAGAAKLTVTAGGARAFWQIIVAPTPAN